MQQGKPQPGLDGFTDLDSALEELLGETGETIEAREEQAGHYGHRSDRKGIVSSKGSGMTDNAGFYSLKGSSREQVFSDLRRPTRLDRRKASRPTPARLARIGLEQKLNLEEFVRSTKRLADVCFREGYSLLLNGEEYTNGRYEDSTGVRIGMSADDLGYTKGRIEFYFGKGFSKRVEGTLMFIKEIARYLGCRPGFTDEELVEQAYKSIPDITGSRTEYRAVFRFDAKRSTITFDTVLEENTSERNMGRDDDQDTRQISDQALRYATLSNLSVGEVEMPKPTGFLDDEGNMIYE